MIEETRTDGWCYGAITEFIDEAGCHEGDAFVEAPDGRRAGLVWDVDDLIDPPIQIMEGPDSHADWGLYQIYYPRKVYTMQDMVENFQMVLPHLKEVYRKVKAGEALVGYRYLECK